MRNQPQHESRSVESMRLFLGESLPSVIYGPKLFYDAKRAEIRGDQEGDSPRGKAIWLAELTIQHHGSAYADYESVTKAEVHKVLMYVQARHMNDDFLIVGHQLDTENRLIHPARLSLQDLIGYKGIEKVKE